ncbi:MAG: ARMT1-like domain-containing protein [Desulfurococcaceae archaeon]
MKPRFECLRCLLATRLKEIEKAEISDQKRLELAREVIQEVLGNFNYEIELTEFASILFNNLVSKAPEIIDYYLMVKRASNVKALRNLKVHIDYVSKLRGYDRFKYLVKLSAIANLIDYGVADHTKIVEEIQPNQVVEYKTSIDDIDKLYERVLRGNCKVLWLFDNAGEAVYDMLLIREIRDMGNTVIGLVKDHPGFQNDVTLRDLEEIESEEGLNAIYTYGCNCSTIHLDHVNEKILEIISEADLIIAKGMGHFEYLSEIDLNKPICFILIPKCTPVAEKIGKNSYMLINVICKFV